MDMERVIKFMAFDKTKKIIFEIFDSSTQKNWFLPSWKENFEVMQYTGLRDKNGKEIYDGYLLKGHDGFIYRVWFVKGGFAINVHVEKFKNDIKMSYPFPLQPLSDEQTCVYVESECEVIGNIYETKLELL
jgi:uncharacterized phage protein (TIGR01671 family)